MSENLALFRSRRYARVGGVCAGIALARGYSILLTRVIALLLLSYGGLGLLVYLLMWILVPKVDEAAEPEAVHDPFKRSSNNAMLGGVCAGIAKMLDFDVAMTRVLVAVLVIMGGAGVLPYVYAWIMVPRD